jgi:hypothetical protein
LQDLFSRQCIVAGTAFRVEEPEQLLKGFRIGCVSQKRTLALHAHKPLIPELVEVMGKR